MWGQGICGNLLHLPLNFSMNLKLLEKLKSAFFFLRGETATSTRIGQSYCFLNGNVLAAHSWGQWLRCAILDLSLPLLL